MYFLDTSEGFVTWHVGCKTPGSGTNILFWHRLALLRWSNIILKSLMHKTISNILSLRQSLTDNRMVGSITLSRNQLVWRQFYSIFQIYSIIHLFRMTSVRMELKMENPQRTPYITQINIFFTSTNKGVITFIMKFQAYRV